MKIVYLFCAILCFGGSSMLSLPTDDEFFIPIKNGSLPDYINNNGSLRDVGNDSKSIREKLSRIITANFGKNAKYSFVHFNITLKEIPRNSLVAVQNRSSEGSVIFERTQRKRLASSNLTKSPENPHSLPLDYNNAVEEIEEYGNKSLSQITYDHPKISSLQFNINLKENPRNPLAIVENNSTEVSQKIEEANVKNESPEYSHDYLSDNNTIPKGIEEYEEKRSPQIVPEYPKIPLHFNITLGEIPRKFATTVENSSSEAPLMYSSTQKKETGLSNITKDVHKSPEYSENNALDNGAKIEDFDGIQFFYKLPKFSSAHNITLKQLAKKPMTTVGNESSQGSFIFDEVQHSINVINNIPQFPEYSYNDSLVSEGTMGDIKDYGDKSQLASSLMSNETNGGNSYVWNLIPPFNNYLEDAYDHNFDNKAIMEKNNQSSDDSQFSNGADVEELHVWDSTPETNKLLEVTLDNKNIVLDEVKNSIPGIEEDEPNTIEEYPSFVIETPSESRFSPELSSDENMFNLTVKPADFGALVKVPNGSFLNSTSTEKNCTDCTKESEATTGMKLIECMCAIFTTELPSENDIPLTSKTFYNKSCHQDVPDKDACEYVCIDAATIEGELDDNMVCSFVESHETNLKAFLYSKLCGDNPEWNFTGVSSVEPVCCYRGSKILC